MWITWLTLLVPHSSGVRGASGRLPVLVGQSGGKPQGDFIHNYKDFKEVHDCASLWCLPSATFRNY